jgi:hypothetical protein
MKRAISVLAACAAMTSAVPASAQPHHEDPHSRGVRTHAHYFSPPPRYHDNHHYYEGEVWHGHPLAYRNGSWGYTGPSGVFVHISL